VIILTGNTEQADRIIGLELGADDFIGKLQNPREIVARIRSLIRRSASRRMSDIEPIRPTEDRKATLNVPRTSRGDASAWTIDVARRNVFMPDGSPIGLTAAEFDMLLFFARAPGQIIGRKDLFVGVFGREQSGPFDRTVDNLVSRLRRALGHHGLSGDVFKSIRGKGYIFTGYNMIVTPASNHHASDEDTDIKAYG
jgi:two-component system OmpR family response regulator